VYVVAADTLGIKEEEHKQGIIDRWISNSNFFFGYIFLFFLYSLMAENFTHN
jgi:hypothetical protein